MVNIPTDEQIRAELHKTLASDQKLKCCANCVHYSQVSGHCRKTDKTFPRYMYACRHYETAEEQLIAKAREELKAQARECEKVEFLLAMALTSANMTTLFIEDFERRVKAVHRREKERTTRGHLRKDLDLAEEMDGAMKKIGDMLGKIEQQYRFYIQEHLDKIFKREGVYNAEGHDQFAADAGEFAVFLLEMARVAHHNPGNMDKVYAYMQELKNAETDGLHVAFCLEDKDIRHYRLKG